MGKLGSSLGLLRSMAEVDFSIDDIDRADFNFGLWCDPHWDVTEPKSTALNGRSWVSDVGSSYAPVIQYTDSVTHSNKNSSVSTVPYMMPRIFQTAYTYSFPIIPGRKFIRHYFYPLSYTNPNFVVSDSFFSVSVSVYVGPRTFLNNFNPLLTTQAMTKEFSINILLGLWIWVFKEQNLGREPAPFVTFVFLEA
ncbi:putative receptor-like protein kinase [Acorus gramineus]|uniref:Receptor-like protein kinase n=1 Tax=Acorus gramineus TaxID=55184 RepID=A0AAV9B6Q9_ACOGR|nr:putative receptor-like protein kinase [Acorus gramineus]